MNIDWDDGVRTVTPEGIVFKVNDEPVLALRMEYPKGYQLDEITMDMEGEGEFRAWGLFFSWEHPDSFVYNTMVFLEELVGLPTEDLENDDGEEFFLTAHDVTAAEIDAMIAFGTVEVEHYKYTGKTYQQSGVEETS